MSENEILAMAYSAKCARRRRRKEAKRNALIQGVIRFMLPFSIGTLSMACIVAGVL